MSAWPPWTIPSGGGRVPGEASAFPALLGDLPNGDAG